MLRRPAFVTLALLLSVGAHTHCASSSDRPVDGADASADAALDVSLPPPDVVAPPNGHDLSKGKWTLSQVSQTPGTISHDGSMAFTPDGTPWAAWSEPDSIKTSIQNIWVGSQSGGTWTGKAVTNDTDVQNAYPSLVEHDATLQLVWNGYPNTDNDLFHLAYEKGAWSARTDLTSFDEGKNLRSDYQPNMVFGKEGRMLISYSSQPADPKGVGAGPSYVRLLALPNGAIPNGAPENVIADSAGCYSSSIAVDAAGHLHVVADCGPLNDLDILYATNAGGTWTQTAIPGGTGKYETSPSLVVDPDGKTIHLAWTRDSPCASKPDSNCGAVFYTTIKDGAIGTPLRVTQEPDRNETTCKLIVDALGQVLIGFERFNAQNFSDVWVTWSKGGGAPFSAPINLTPNTDAQDDNGPTSFVLHPKTGNIHLLFWSVIPKSDPLNSEIWHAEFIPDSGPVN